MTVARATEPGAPRTGRIRAVGVLLVLAGATLIALGPAWNARLSAAAFDAYQVVSPRPIQSTPAIIVAIDERSLATLGRWPWPRTRLAQLIEAIAHARPAAIGIDIFMPEPDPFSPDRVLAQAAGGSAAGLKELGPLPSNDSTLARALTRAPTVLAIAGTPAPTGMPLRVAPLGVQGSAPDALAHAVLRFAGALPSLDELNRAAAGWGLASAVPEHGVIRRIPLVASIDGTLVPALAVEVLRVASRSPSLRLVASGPSAQGISLGSLFIPTEADGGARIHFSPRNAERFVSAVDVLEGKFDPQRLQQRLVIVGVTALGLGERHATPLGDSMPGTEVHVQLLESAVDGTLLVRPRLAPFLEAAAFAFLGALLVWIVPVRKPRNAALLGLACIAIVVAAAFWAFRAQRIVLDAATPSLGLIVVFVALLLMTLAESMRVQRTLQRVLQTQREHGARIAGELEAARRIQLASLPSPDLLRGDARLDLAATMTPALEVGGDLYDFFRLDERRLFFIVGDVAGKGVSASIFMAVSKALYKSTMLRSPKADIGAIMAEANAEVSRDNPEMMFVTAFAALLDLDSGDLDYCNAGHENPFAILPTDDVVEVLDDGGGPPLCTVDGFAYRGARYRMRRGELLCLFSDGVTDAQDSNGAMYGRQRVRDLLSRANRSDATARGVVDRLLGDVDAFAGGNASTDDVTVLALRWIGPRAAGQDVSTKA